MRSRVGDAELEELVVEAAAGDRIAWQRLWTALEPRVCGSLRKSWRQGIEAHRDDEIRDLFVATMARLSQHRFRRLQLYLTARSADPELNFMRWLFVVAHRVKLDRLRLRRAVVVAGTGEPPLGEPAVFDRVAAGQIVRYASQALTARQRSALEVWAGHGSHDDIAARLGLAGPEAATRLVRAALGRLRRHFRAGA